MRRRGEFVTALPVAFCCFLAACGRTDESTPTVVLISIDTLRPERLGVYGNGTDVSPAIDALARDGVVFEQALAVAPWTLPSHMSMLTGLDPIAHGVRVPGAKLPSKVETLAELLGGAGFRTAAFADGGFVGGGWGYEQGFEIFDSVHGRTDDQRGFARYLDQALAWIDAAKSSPIFLFLHSFDVHAPYQEGDPEVLARFRARSASDGPDDHHLHRGSFTHYARAVRLDEYGRMSEVMNDYDAGVFEADRAVGRVVAKLKEAGRYEDALIVVTSDHGESFYDHELWIGHGLQLTDDEIHVPLVVKFPRNEGAGRRVGSLVDLLDYAPTILAAAGRPSGKHMRGSDLRALIRGESRSRSYVFGDTYCTETKFLVRDGLKYVSEASIPSDNVVLEHLKPSTPGSIEHLVEGVETRRKAPDGSELVTSYSYVKDPLGLLDSVQFHSQLFDRRADPGERRNLAEERAEESTRMQRAIAALTAESQRIHRELAVGDAERKLTPNEVRGLEALGYALGGSEESAEAGLDEKVDRLRREPRRAPPSMEGLYEVDRRLHAIRIAIRAGRAPERETGMAELAACADKATDWFVELGRPTFHMRALWRVREAAQLAEQLGGKLNESRCIARMGKALRGAAAKSTER